MKGILRGWSSASVLETFIFDADIRIEKSSNGL